MVCPPVVEDWGSGHEEETDHEAHSFQWSYYQDSNKGKLEKDFFFLFSLLFVASPVCSAVV